VLEIKNGVNRRVGETTRTECHHFAAIASKTVVLELYASTAQRYAAAETQNYSPFLSAVIAVSFFVDQGKHHPGRAYTHHVLGYTSIRKARPRNDDKHVRDNKARGYLRDSLTDTQSLGRAA
jgi:hypothetical protein